VATLEEQEQLVKLLQKEEEHRIKIERLKGETISKLEIEARLIRVQAEEQEKLIEMLELDQATRNKLILQEERIVNELERKGRISAQIAQQKRDFLRESRNLQGQLLDDAKKELAKKQELLKTQLDNNVAIRAGAEATGQMADSLSRAVGFGPGLTKNILDAAKAGGSFKDIFDKAGTSLKENFSDTGILAFAITNTAQLLKSFDEITASLAASTGQGRSFAGVVEEAFSNTSDFATTLQDTAEAVDGLYSSYVGFAKLSKSAKTSLTENVTLMERLGISAEEAGERLTFFTTVMGMTSEAAKDANDKIVRLAIGLGQGPRSLSAQFNQLMPQLSLFGSKAQKVFSDTAIAARQFGLDMKTGAQDLFNLTQGLQDFESAASKVATINVVLGGSFVNAFDLVMAAGKGPVAQVELLQDAFRQAGKSMDDMGFYERKLLADEMGISFGNLQKIMEGQQLTEKDMLSTEEQMMNAIKDTASVMDKMNSALQTLTITLTPLLKALIPVVDMLASFIKWGGDIALILYSVGAAVDYVAFSMLGLSSATATAFSGLAAGFIGGYLAVKKLSDHLSTEGMGMIATLAGIAAAVTAIAGNIPLALLFGGVAAAFGLGAFGVISSGGAENQTTTQSVPLGEIGTGKATTAFLKEAEMPTVFSRRQFGGFIPPGATVQVDPGEQVFAKAPKGGAEVISQKDVRIADKISQSGIAGAALVPVLAKQVEKLTKAIMQQQQQQPAPQPLEVVMQVDGRKLAKTVVSRINDNFGFGRNAPLPSEKA